MSIAQVGSTVTGSWSSGTTISSGSLNWGTGNLVLAFIRTVGGGTSTVASIANSGTGLGTWFQVSDGTNAAEGYGGPVLGEVWAAYASASGSGTVTPTLANTYFGAGEICVIVLSGAASMSVVDAVQVVTTHANSPAPFPTAVSVSPNTQALAVQFFQPSASLDVLFAGYSSLVSVVNSGVETLVYLQSSPNASAGTSVTPGGGTGGGTTTGFGGSVAMTILLKNAAGPTNATFILAESAPRDATVTAKRTGTTISEAAPSAMGVVVSRAFTTSNSGLGEHSAGRDSFGVHAKFTLSESGAGHDGFSVEVGGRTIAGAVGERGAGTDAVSVVVAGVGPTPAPVTNLAAERAGGAAGTQAQLTWTPSLTAGVSGYVVSILGRADQTISGGASTGATITGLTNGKLYTFGVAAVGSAGARSAIRKISLFVGPAAAASLVPAGLTATGQERQIVLAWDAPTGSGASTIASAEVWSGADGITAYLATVALPNLTYTATHLLAGQAYSYAVRWIDVYGNAGSFCAPATATAEFETIGGIVEYMTAAQLMAVTDEFGKMYLIIVGTYASGYGMGSNNQSLGSDWGYSAAIRNLIGDLLADGDKSLIDYVYPAVNSAYNALGAVPYQTEVRAKLNNQIASLGNLAVALSLSGVSDLNSLLTYYNIGSGGSWQALVAPEFALAYNATSNRTFTPTNVYAPSNVSLGSIAHGGSFSAGATVDNTQYAGAGSAVATTTGWTGTSGTVTVTGTATNAAGATASGRTFTGTIAGNGTISLSPSVSGDLLLSVTAITLPGSMTAGTTTIYTAPPSGRTEPTVP